MKLQILNHLNKCSSNMHLWDMLHSNQWQDIIPRGPSMSRKKVNLHLASECASSCMEYSDYFGLSSFQLGLGFIVGGAITYSGYRNGIYFTLGILSVSGFLSLIFHGDEVNPVSVAWGDAMLMTSIMCSIGCMIMVALPLMISTLKSGWPEPIENLLGSSSGDTGKKQVTCQSCQTALQIPDGYSGSIECPSCKSQMKV